LSVPITTPYGRDNPSRTALRTPLRILIVEYEQSLRESCRTLLEHDGHEVVAVGRGDEARDLVQRRRFDLALVDLHLPQVSGVEVVQAFHAAQPDARVIVVTGSPSVESSLAVHEAGAWHYLPKPFTASHLQILVGRAMHDLAAAPRPAEAKGEDDAVDTAAGMSLLGRSPAFHKALWLADQVARTDASVMLVGESGAGKEMVAQYIHRKSRRGNTPLIAVNCAALPEALLESEMFGHVKGAFTGAIRDKPGLLEAAHNGTLFLDELTEMAPAIQAKLLRVLQDGVVRRVGSESTDATVNVRFIAATNRDPMTAVDQGILRKDLYYRLSVVPIRVPSLRERVEDIPILAEHFLKTYWKKHREKGEPMPRFTPEAMRSLQSRRWSGNVRELQNLIEHAVVVLEPGAQIHPDDFPYRDGPEERLDGESDLGGSSLMSELAELDYHSARERLLGDFEKVYIQGLVERCRGNLSKAAKEAGMDRTTLYRLMEKHQLHPSTTVTSTR